MTPRGHRTRRVDVAARLTTKVRVEARRGTVRRLRGRVVRPARVRAVDAAGNLTGRTLRLRLR